jgi:hypothetical protein
MRPVLIPDMLGMANGNSNRWTAADSERDAIAMDLSRFRRHKKVISVFYPTTTLI